MKFYPVEIDGVPQLVDTQVEAKAIMGRIPDPVDYPADKDGMRTTLNRFLKAGHHVPVREESTVQTENTHPEVPERELSKWSAEAVLAKMDGKPCPTCGYDPKAVRAGTLIAKGVDQDECIAFVESAPSWAVGNIVAAIMERLPSNEQQG